MDRRKRKKYQNSIPSQQLSLFVRGGAVWGVVAKEKKEKFTEKEFETQVGNKRRKAINWMGRFTSRLSTWTASPFFSAMASGVGDTRVGTLTGEQLKQF